MIPSALKLLGTASADVPSCFTSQTDGWDSGRTLLFPTSDLRLPTPSPDPAVPAGL